MATSTIKNDLKDMTQWLVAQGKSLTVHLDNSSDILVITLSHGYVGVFHANAAGLMVKKDLLNETGMTINYSTNNTVSFSSSSLIVLNVLCKRGTAYIQ